MVIRPLLFSEGASALPHPLDTANMLPRAQGKSRSHRETPKPTAFWNFWNTNKNFCWHYRKKENKRKEGRECNLGKIFTNIVKPISPTFPGTPRKCLFPP